MQNLNNKKLEIDATLYKNKYESIGDISKDITEEIRKYDDCNILSFLTCNRFNNGSINPIYNEIKIDM